MKIEIEKSEYDRLKSREEKLMAYYEWFVDKENDLVTVEDIVNKNTELEEENRKLKEEIKKLGKENFVMKDRLKFWYKWVTREEIERVEEENKKLKKELELVRKNTRANVETLDNMYWENVDLKKENKELQRENDKLKIHTEAKDKAYMDLLADYNYQKARIKKTERAFIKYKEKLEKLEVDLDMVVMNR